ncbi:aquaporin-like protein [Sistotremastrum niveocremeum HHB9708]|uniref:Aquaporin-like protein n=2 Tax=Sistotremastraceae TaxID=3402574 RepID=A0A164U8P5_9AGAM|nr:aquaporin-like protein [Sistotremastrum niveocremeum HHB9708]KZT44313.1 aquaporin-like protein [Sistotremastrum suecicum HHB10207 ss-3]
MLFDTWREDAKAAILEFLGTIMFLLLALGGTQNANFQGGPANDRLMYIAASFGLSLVVSAWLFFRATGGLFNPNVTLALLLVGAISPLRFVLYCIAQLVGSIVASGILLGLVPGPLLVTTQPGPGINKAQATFIEMFLTTSLVLAVLMLAAEKHKSTAWAPIGVGLTLFAAELWGLSFTGGSLNTARSFGPAVVAGFDESHWVYWLGPFLGSLLGTAIYTLLKTFDYWNLNPGQDSSDPSLSPDNPVNALTETTRSRSAEAGNSVQNREKTINRAV